MATDPQARDRIEAIKGYFRKVDARDPTFLDLCTDDVQFFFPKFGLAHGKDAIARFGERMARHLEGLEHDIDGFTYIVSGDLIAVEGQERGVMRGGERWPDGIVSQGRFCNVFEFDGPLIRRIHIYVDPDYANADRERLRAFRGQADAGDATRGVVARYFEMMGSGAVPEEMASLFSEDVDWDIPGDTRRVPWIGRKKGRAGAAEFVRDLRERIESIRFEVRSVVAEGERAVALGELVSRVKATGRTIESEFAFEFRVQGGLITRFRLFEDSFAVAQATAQDS